MKSASECLRGLAERHRKTIAEEYKRRGGRFSRWIATDWDAMQAAIFVLENDLEHKGAARGVSDVEPVLGMRRRRVALEVLLGEDYPMTVVT